MQKKHKKLIILTAGGTGGHIFPAQAVAETLQSEYNLLLIADTRAKQFLAGVFQKLPTIFISSNSLSGSLLNKLSCILRLLLSTANLMYKFSKLKPSLIIGFGGYPTLPAVAAALILRIPIIIHEQNAVIGQINRIFAPFAKIILTSFSETREIPNKYLNKIVYTGNPVRQDIISAKNKNISYDNLQLQPNHRTYAANSPASNDSEDIKTITSAKIFIVVIGGSQGASILSSLVPKAIQLLPYDMQQKIIITQQVRANLVEETVSEYKKTQAKFDAQPFYHNIAELLSSADLVISRAGAMTVAELIYLAKPSILIPFSQAKYNHQFYNAMFLVKNKAALLLEEINFNERRLSKMITELLSMPSKLQELANNIQTISKKDARLNIHRVINNFFSSPNN